MTDQMTASPVRDYIDQYKTLPADATLGHIVWYSVADGEYDPAFIEQEFLRLGLSLTYLPGPINPHDAFEKAAKSLDNTRYELNPVGTTTVPGVQFPDHHAIVLMREAKRDKEKVVRQLWREIRDSKNAKLRFDQVGEVVFYRPVMRNGKIDYSSWRIRRQIVGQPVSVTEQQALDAMLKKFDDQFARHLSFHDGQKIRTIVRGYLTYLNAIAMKDSVYFIFNNRTPELLALKEFCENLQVKKTAITVVPLADLPALREDVIEAWEREAIERLIEVSDAIDKLMANRVGPPKIEAYTKLMAQYQDVMDRAGEYTRTLQVSQDSTADTALHVQGKLADLQSAVATGLANGAY